MKRGIACAYAARAFTITGLALLCGAAQAATGELPQGISNGLGTLLRWWLSMF